MNPTLLEIDELGRALQRDAAAGDWPTFADNLAQRDHLIRDYTARSHDPAALAVTLERLLDETREWLEVAAGARRAVAAELRQMDAGRQAVQAYGGTERAGRRELAARAADDSPGA